MSGNRISIIKCIIHTSIFAAEGTPGPWGDWVCDASCGETVEYRNRTCVAPDDVEEGCGFECDFDLSQTVQCFAGCCDGELSLSFVCFM